MSKNIRRNRHKIKHERGTKSYGSAILTGLAVAFSVSALLILIAALAVYSAPNPSPLILSASLAALYISAFSGGFACSTAMDGDTAGGTVCGFIFFLAVLIISLILPFGASEKIGIGASIGLHSVALIFSFLGSLAAASLASRRRRKPRRHKRA